MSDRYSTCDCGCRKINTGGECLSLDEPAAIEAHLNKLSNEVDRLSGLLWFHCSICGAVEQLKNLTGGCPDCGATMTLWEGKP